MFNYPYTRTRDALERMRRADAWDPYHGLKVRYTNPITGNHAMATMGIFVQLLPKGFTTAAYRSTDATVLVPIEGKGRTHIGDDFIVEWNKATFSSSRAGNAFSTRRRRTVCCSRCPTGPFKKRSICSGRTVGMSEKIKQTEYVLPPPAAPSVAVAGTDARFPVRRIICVGRNYAAHAREMGRDPDREPPFFFLKPADTVVDNGATVPYPPETSNFHYEIELIVAIGKGGADIPVERALDHVYGYAVGIDDPRRDLQLQAREQGRPWDWGKGFDFSAPIAPLRRVEEVGHPEIGAASGLRWTAK